MQPVLIAVRAAGLLCALLLAPGLCAEEDYEQRFLALRELHDRIRIAEARGLDAGATRPQLAARLADFQATPVPADPVAAAIAARVHEGLLSLPVATAAGTPAPDCTAAPDAAASLPELRQHTYHCYGQAARSVEVDGVQRDRLWVLHELARASEPARRKALLLALQPMFRTVNGDNTPQQSPFRRMQPLVAQEWQHGNSPIQRNLVALGIAPQQLEPWLVGILEAWRDLGDGAELEPWDYEYAGSALERTLGARVPRERMEAINVAYHASLGADPAALNIQFDLAPRPGKTVVAFTDFGARPQQRPDGSWSSGEPWIFASYSSGGIGNLNELLHETGHAIHIAGIRTRPVYADWPDSDALTEAFAEILSQEVQDAAWQRRWLGASASLEDNLRARYSGIVLDVAWGLFELRAYAAPQADPNQLWTDITQRYLHVRPHPELSWWARRGQLVDTPGYMMNYALGAILAADMRARARELRGAPTGGDAGYYPWLVDQLFRFGREKGAAAVLSDFLGRSPDPRALLADMRRREGRP